MRISSASPPPHAVVPDSTPSAGVTHSTLRRRIPYTTPEPQRAERTDATGAPIKQGDSSQKTSLSQAALHNLPNELLLQIAGRTGPRGEGVDLNLRRVSQQMKVIADDQLSPKQRFLAENGPNLHAVGYSGEDMTKLAALPVTARDFVLANGQQLRAAGYNYGFKMNALAARPAAEHDFVLGNAQRLHAVGYTDGMAMTALAARPAAERDFVLGNAQPLHAVGYSGEDMTELAALPVTARDFVLANGQQLRAAGYNYGFKMNALAARPDQRNAFLRQIGQRD